MYPYAYIYIIILINKNIKRPNFWFLSWHVDVHVDVHVVRMNM